MVQNFIKMYDKLYSKLSVHLIICSVSSYGYFYSKPLLVPYIWQLIFVEYVSADG